MLPWGSRCQESISPANGTTYCYTAPLPREPSATGLPHATSGAAAAVERQRPREPPASERASSCPAAAAGRAPRHHVARGTALGRLNNQIPRICVRGQPLGGHFPAHCVHRKRGTPDPQNDSSEIGSSAVPSAPENGHRGPLGMQNAWVSDTSAPFLWPFSGARHVSTSRLTTSLFPVLLRRKLARSPG